MIKTDYLDDIFSMDKGWEYPSHIVPLQRKFSEDGGIYYEIHVDGVPVHVVHINRFSKESKSGISPNRIFTYVHLSGGPTNLEQLKNFMIDNASLKGIPHFGFGDNGIFIQAAFPLPPGLSLDLARKMMLVNIGMIVYNAKILCGEKAEDLKREMSDNSWETAKNISSVLGAFLGAFFGEID